MGMITCNSQLPNSYDRNIVRYPFYPDFDPMEMAILTKDEVAEYMVYCSEFYPDKDKIEEFRKRHKIPESQQIYYVETQKEKESLTPRQVWSKLSVQQFRIGLTRLRLLFEQDEEYFDFIRNTIKTVHRRYEDKTKEYFAYYLDENDQEVGGCGYTPVDAMIVLFKTITWNIEYERKLEEKRKEEERKGYNHPDVIKAYNRRYKEQNECQ